MVLTIFGIVVVLVAAATVINGNSIITTTAEEDSSPSALLLLGRNGYEREYHHTEKLSVVESIEKMELLSSLAESK